MDCISFYVTDTITAGTPKPYAWRMLIQHTNLNALTQFNDASELATGLYLMRLQDGVTSTPVFINNY